jgi:transposase
MGSLCYTCRDMNIVQTYSKSKAKQGKIYKGAILLRESYREDGKVKNRTIANLSHCKPEEIEAIRLALKHKADLTVLGSREDISLNEGLSVGAVWTVYSVARQLGIERALGTDREGKLALWQVIARVIEQGSRLSATRLGQRTAACDILGIADGFDENALYDNLSWITANQQEIERKLLQIRRKGKTVELFLYDVTSSYLEGEHNELGDWGYNRDKKKGKMQLVVGLLCDEEGSPVSVEVFRGNTNDLSTFASQVKKASEQYGCVRVTFVGDRGMIKSGQIDELTKAGFYYITAITKPQIRTMINAGILQLSLFEENLCEVIDDGLRYVLKRNPVRADEMKLARRKKLESVQSTAAKLNEQLKDKPKASLDKRLEQLRNKIIKLNAQNWLRAEAVERQLSLVVDEAALAREGELDGCYALKSDLPAADVGFETIHDRYKDLAKVEQAFRTSKTGMLELRPWYVRSEASTRGHAMVVTLAYLIAKKLRESWSKFDVTVTEGLQQLSSLSTIEIVIKGKASIHQIPTPTEMSAKLLEAAAVTLPKALPSLGATVVTRKTLARNP